MPESAGETAWESTQAGGVAEGPCWMKSRESSLVCDGELEWGRDRSRRYGNDGEMVMYIESKLRDLAFGESASKSDVNMRDSVDPRVPIPVSVRTLGRDKCEPMRADVVVESGNDKSGK